MKRKNHREGTGCPDAPCSAAVEGKGHKIKKEKHKLGARSPSAVNIQATGGSLIGAKNTEDALTKGGESLGKEVGVPFSLLDSLAVALDIIAQGGNIKGDLWSVKRCAGNKPRRRMLLKIVVACGYHINDLGELEYGSDIVILDGKVKKNRKALGLIQQNKEITNP
jgi:hypothetical protein